MPSCAYCDVLPDVVEHKGSYAMYREGATRVAASGHALDQEGCNFPELVTYVPGKFKLRK